MAMMRPRAARSQVLKSGSNLSQRKLSTLSVCKRQKSIFLKRSKKQESEHDAEWIEVAKADSEKFVSSHSKEPEKLIGKEDSNGKGEKRGRNGEGRDGDNNMEF